MIVLLWAGEGLDMEKSVEVFAAINFFVIGVSHIVMRKGWAEFFLLLRSKGEAGSFINGFLNLATGSLIVAFHNVWAGLPMILTLIGWAYVLKSFLIFVVPGFGQRSLARVSIERANLFIIPGLFLLAVSGVMAYTALTS